MSDIAVIDYGMGNLRSVAKALEHVAPERSIVVTSDPAQILAAERVVFPGQGAMPDCVRELDSRDLRRAIHEAAASKPFLGICIGLQLLFDHSEEGNVDGLGILPGKVKRFPQARMVDAAGNKLKVPHMGWNEVHQTCDHPMWKGIAKDARFYFVHSYYVEPEDAALETAYTEYPFRFTSAVGRDNIFAVQFHPEKSQQAGLSLLFNFVNWDGRP
jgi:glutamine amidotransferase